MAKQSNARFATYMKPVVAVLRERGYSAKPKEVVAAIQQMVDVPADHLERTTKSGQTIFENDVHWCRAYLAKAGFIDASKRGVWTLTAKGRSEEFSDEVVQEIVRTVQGQSKRQREGTVLTADEVEDVVEGEAERNKYREDALDKLKSLTPKAFEYFCRALLLEAGFEDVEVTGRSGDRGIDGRGTLKINPLFSMKVGFQAKRYQESVGPGVVRDFRGAIVGRADRGLLITTGTFTREAEIEASRDGATQIELIDGSSIIDLMQEYEFGLVRIETFKLNHDLFERFNE